MSRCPAPIRCPGPQPFLPRSRREFLKAAGCGFGLLGLADLLAREARARPRAARRTARRRGRAISRPRPSAAFSCS